MKRKSTPLFDSIDKSGFWPEPKTTDSIDKKLEHANVLLAMKRTWLGIS